MDTSETYIKMCDCPEIQALRPVGNEWEAGDFYHWVGEWNNCYFTTVARDSGVKTGAKEDEGWTEECKAFSDEAVLTGISHYITMGYDKKEAVNNFIASNELDKKYYEPLINEVLDRYNY